MNKKKHAQIVRSQFLILRRTGDLIICYIATTSVNRAKKTPAVDNSYRVDVIGTYPAVV